MLFHCIKNGQLILPKKQKYNNKDLNNLITNSLFLFQKTMTRDQAIQIIKESAAYHGVECSKFKQCKE